MCDACEPMLNRRLLLRGALLGGTALATSGLWMPATAHAVGGDDDPEVEFAAMAEDRVSTTARPQTDAAAREVTMAAQPATGSTQLPASGALSGATAITQIPSPNANAFSAPPIVPRSGWGANEAIRLDGRSYAPVRKLIVHHSASDNKPSNPASVVRFVQNYHTTGRGFTDTGYNYLIDHKGIIYEGRAARRYAVGEAISTEDSKGWGVVGAHAKSNNAGTCGVCLIGNFDAASPTDAALASLVWLLSWKASRHRIDPSAAEDYIDIYGNRRAYPNISGHRTVGYTACPGSRLFTLLPTIRDEVAARAGHWDPVTVNVPAVLRREWGNLRAGDPNGGSPGGSGTGGTGGTAVDPGAAPGTGTKLVGFRVVSSVGKVYTAGKGRALGDPARNGAPQVVALANGTTGDGYWALGANGAVVGFGGVGVYGDAAGKGVAADITPTPSGKGYWILMADGGIYPCGDAGYASSPKRAGLGGTSLRIAARPQADGYWVLMAGNIVRAFGRAPALAAPQSALGSAVDLWPTPSGKGYWVLTDTGVVAPFGDAGDKGDPKRAKVKWSRQPAAHIVGTQSGAGYVVANAEGSMLAFGDAPLFASFGGSGMRAVGVAAAFG